MKPLRWAIQKVGKEYWAVVNQRPEDSDDPALWSASLFTSRDQNEVDQYIQDMIEPKIVKEFP